MLIRIRKKLMNFTVFLYLLEFMHTYRKAQKDPAFWVKKQQKNIRSFVRHLYKIPFYRERFEKAGILPKDIVTEEDFLKLPPLTREEYRQWVNDEIESHPSKYKEWLQASTSGSTSEPLVFKILPEDRASDVANLYRIILSQNCGFRLFRGKTMAMMISKSSAHTFLERFGLFRNCQCYAMNPTSVLYDSYRSFQPDFLYGINISLYELAQYSIRRSETIKQPLCVASISSTISDHDRFVLEKAFGKGKIFDMYGSTEVGNFAFEKMGQAHNYYLWHDTHVVNVIDENGNSVKDGRGEILVTTMYHRGFPLVNYTLNDCVDTYQKNGIRYLRKIIGRTNDRVWNEDGTSYNWLSIDNITKELAGVAYCQVRQTEYDVLEIWLVEDQRHPVPHDIIETLLSDRAKEQFADHPKALRFIWTDAIPPNKNNKRKLLVCMIPGKEGQAAEQGSSLEKNG